MKLRGLALATSVVALTASHLHAQEGVVGLTAPANYSSQPIPFYITRSNTPGSPCMHNGVFSTLAQVINHYNAIPGDNANLDPRLRRPGGVQNLNLSQQQRTDLVAFLQTLTGSSVYTAARWSNPFAATGALTLAVLPSTDATIQKNSDGPATVSCKGAVGLQYQLQFSADLRDWTTMATLIPDGSGT